MKKIVYVLFLVVLAACRKEQSAPVIQIEGMWAEYDGSELTKSFYEFGDGKFSYYISKLDYLVRDTCLWGADKTDFIRQDFGDYSIQNGRLMLNERNAGNITLDSLILTVGSTRYQRINALKKGVAGASKIILQTDSVTIRPELCDTTVTYRVINLLPGNDAVTARYDGSPDWTMYPFVTRDEIILGGRCNESPNPRSAVMVISYPWAEDETIVLTQSPARISK